MGDHFYTVDQAERDRALASGTYHWERSECNVYPPNGAGPPGTVELFRLFNSDRGAHFFTTDPAERDRAISVAGYRSEGTACRVMPSATAGTLPLFRLFNAGQHDHLYTTDPNERTRAHAQLGYVDEGIQCYVYPAAPPNSTTPLYRIYGPSDDGGFLGGLGDFLSGVGDFISDVITTVGGAVITAADGFAGWILSSIGWVLNLTLFNIPFLGGLLRWGWNGLLTLGSFAASFPDALAGFLGFRPEKKMRVLVVIQLADGHAVADVQDILPKLQIAIDTFKDQANIRLIPVGPFVFTSPFQDTPTASNDYLYTESESSGPDTLTVHCQTDLFLGDIGTTGTAFNSKLTLDLFFANWRRLAGYGAPVVAFAVKEFVGTESKGCSLGPLADWVIVDFKNASTRTLAHEFGHACGLFHPGDAEASPDNLMTPGSKNGVGLALTDNQITVIRSSRHVTYL
jgi:hypothetical protein